MVWALNRTTSRRSEQRRDVPERIFANVATLWPTSQRSREGSFPTSQRSIQCRDVPENVKNQRRDVDNQRSVKSTSRRWISTSRRSRGVQNQRRDVPEKGKIEVATFQRRVKIDVATFRRHDVLKSRRSDVAKF